MSTKVLYERFETIRSLHQITFECHDPENDIAIASARKMREIFADIKKLGVPDDVKMEAVGWLQKMLNSNQNVSIRRELGAGIALLLG